MVAELLQHGEAANGHLSQPHHLHLSTAVLPDFQLCTAIQEVKHLAPIDLVAAARQGAGRNSCKVWCALGNQMGCTLKCDIAAYTNLTCREKPPWLGWAMMLKCRQRCAVAAATS